MLQNQLFVDGHVQIFAKHGFTQWTLIGDYRSSAASSPSSSRPSCRLPLRPSSTGVSGPSTRGHRRLQCHWRRHLLSPIIVARLVPSARGITLVWLLGGLLAFAGAMAYAQARRGAARAPAVSMCICATPTDR